MKMALSEQLIDKYLCKAPPRAGYWNSCKLTFPNSHKCKALFLIYINDLPSELCCSPKLFAL